MKIVIPQLVHEKIMHWINKKDIEVSGFGTVKYDTTTQEFHIINAYLLEQEGGAAHTDIDAASLNKLAFESIHDEGDLRWWWHSHVKMQTFWSGTDTATIKDLGKNGWIVATVFNQMRSNKSAVCYTTESELGSLLHYNDDIPTVIDSNIDPLLMASWDESYATNVKERVWGIHTGARSLYDADMSLLNFNQKAHDYNPGILGYGVEDEAKACGMSVDLFMKTLEGDDTKAYCALEKKLLKLEKKGVLK